MTKYLSMPPQKRQSLLGLTNLKDGHGRGVTSAGPGGYWSFPIHKQEAESNNAELILFIVFCLVGG